MSMRIPPKTIFPEVRCLGERVRLVRGEPVRAELVERSSFLVVEQGALAIACHIDHERRQILAFAQAGDSIAPARFAHFTELSVSACRPTSLIAVSRTTAGQLHQTDPVFYDAIAEAATRLERRIDVLAVAMGRLTVDERIVTLLYELALAAGVGDDGGTIELQISRSDIADHLGINPDTVSRVLTRLATSLDFAVSGRRITLRTLASLADATPLAGTLRKAYRR